jgi:branched-chain amino acid transport system substrate-binding protein
MAPYAGGGVDRLRLLVSALAVASLLGYTSGALAQTVRGVTDTEVVIGTITDLSSIGALQGVNNSDAIRMAFDDVNIKGGVHGRKIKYIVEDSRSDVSHAKQAMSKMLNSDNVFIMLADGGTPMNDANMPEQFARNVPNVFPLTAARSMYEPYNRLKFAQFASYYDQTRSAVKYFAEQRGRKAFCGMYQDAGMGNEVALGVIAQTEANGVKVVATSTHKGADTDFDAPVARLKEAGCDVIVLAGVVPDSSRIIQTVRKTGWNVDLVGQFVAYDMAVASLPGGVAEGFFCMTPGFYAYPNDPRPAVQEFAKQYKQRYGRDPNFHGEAGYTAASIVLTALDKAGTDLTVDTFIKAMESIHDYKDIFGSELSFGPDQHHGSTTSFLNIVHEGRWVPVTQQALSY